MATDSPSARKRPRHADEDAADMVGSKGSEMKEHPSLYYDDGNVVLSCETTLFRAHRSILARHSPVLRELLHAESLREDRKPFAPSDGCMYVALPDTAADAEALLNVIYNDLRVSSLALAAGDLPLLSSIVRMATKYRLARTAADFLARVKEKWPADLAKHTARLGLEQREHLRRTYRVVQLSCGPSPASDAPPPAPAPNASVHPAHVIVLLRGTGCADRSLLAPLFYALTCAPTDACALAALPPADFARLVRGLERIRGAHAALVARSPTAETLALSGGHTCHCALGIRLFWADLAGATVDTGGVFAADREPVEIWGALGIMLARNPAFVSQYNICGECVQLLVARVNNIRRELWARLPECFDLK